MVLGLVTGIAGLLFPFGSVYGKGNEFGVLRSLEKLFRHWDHLAVPDLHFLLLLLVIPIFAGYLRWLVPGRTASGLWIVGYSLALSIGAVLLVEIGFFFFVTTFVIEGQDRQSLIALACGFLTLTAGAWLVSRNRGAGVSLAANSLIALQTVYVANTLILLVDFIPVGGWMFFPGWEIGALFAFLTTVIYTVQIVFASQRMEVTETRG